MRVLLTFCAIAIAGAIFGQAQIRMAGNVGFRLDGGTPATPIYLVIDNDAANAIVDLGTPGGPAFWSENEYNIVKWNVSNQTGTYTVPFISPSGAYVAPTMNIPTAGSADGSIEFSTFRHDNSLANVPSDVTHMNFDLGGAAGGQNEAMDRFWILDVSSYTTEPANIQVNFLMDAAEFDGGMTTPDLLIQRFNPSLSAWHDWVPATAFASGPDRVSANIPSPQFYRSWTISNSNDPLPIELLDFGALCRGVDGVEVNWTTATEINNSHFFIERSKDGADWDVISPDIHGAGNSSEENDYTYTDSNPFRGVSYYRMTQVDFDGTSETFGPVVSSCDAQGYELVNVFGGSNDPMLQVVFSAARDANFDIEILDMSGKVVKYEASVPFFEGLHTYEINKGDLSYGIYYLKLQNENELFTRKILLN